MARMTAFVFWTGIYNAGLALLLSFPPAYRPLGLHICDPLWGWLIASFLAFTSVVLILAARDLRSPRLLCLLGVLSALRGGIANHPRRSLRRHRVAGGRDGPRRPWHRSRIHVRAAARVEREPLRPALRPS